MQIRQAETMADFETIHAMRAEMAIWDSSECARLGYAGDGVKEAYYNETAAQLRDLFRGAGASMLVAERDRQMLGHAGFAPFAGDEAEVLLVWVTPAARGAGIARTLLATLVDRIRDAGYAGAVLETAPFMAAAIRHYERLGFTRCPPFRNPVPGLGPLTISMRLRF